MTFLTPSSDRLEPEYKEVFPAWKRNPDKTNTGALLKAIQPAIDKGVAAHVGISVSPMIRSRAKAMALDAVGSYDSSKAGLTTHIVNQLQGLKRTSRQEQQVLRVPERVSLDQERVRGAKQELLDSLGREPTMAELADATGLSVKRMTYIRKFRNPVAEGFLSSRRGEDNEEWAPAVNSPLGDGDPWAELVYSDLGEVDRKILEWTIGLHGEPVMSNQEIARRLRMTPGGISQRKARIQALLDEGLERSPF